MFRFVSNTFFFLVSIPSASSTASAWSSSSSIVVLLRLLKSIRVKEIQLIAVGLTDIYEAIMCSFYMCPGMACTHTHTPTNAHNDLIIDKQYTQNRKCDRRRRCRRMKTNKNQIRLNGVHNVIDVNWRSRSSSSACTKKRYCRRPKKNETLCVIYTGKVCGDRGDCFCGRFFILTLTIRRWGALGGWSWIETIKIQWSIASKVVKRGSTGCRWTTSLERFTGNPFPRTCLGKAFRNDHFTVEMPFRSRLAGTFARIDSAIGQLLAAMRN